MRDLGSSLHVALALGLALGAGSARAAGAPVAFLGLRPTSDARLGATAIPELAEAQRLRAVAENVVEVLSGAPLLRHEELRAALGRTYLVDLFECRGVAACQLRLAAPLGRRGVAAALVGDYHAVGSFVTVRLRRFDLVKGRLSDEVTFGGQRAALDTLPPWRTALAQLFVDTGSLVLVTNAPDARCTLDGKPCALSEGGVIADVPEGEHLLELAKEGHRRLHRVVNVKRREPLRVVVPLEELPIQVQKAPDPAARLPTFEAPGEETRVKPFGSLRLALVYDNVNGGEREDPVVPPGARADGGALVALPRPAVLGVSVQAPRQGALEIRGALSAGWVKDDGPEIDGAYAEVIAEDVGFRLALGLAPGIVSSLTAGTLSLPEGFGDLAAGFVGVTLSQSLGPFVVELFGGKHKGQFSAGEDSGSASPAPFGAAHLAFVDEGHQGRLYGEDYPLTLGLSGLVGEERVGLADEAEWAAAAGLAPPVPEQVRVWLASAEVYLPFGKHGSIGGEAYLGEDVHLLEGALWQAPRLDPATGRHRALRSAGGWLQLTANLGEALELRLVAGIDTIREGLDWGVAVHGAPAVRRNRLAAASLVWHLDHLSLGVQLHALETVYADPALDAPVLLGAVLASQLAF